MVDVPDRYMVWLARLRMKDWKGHLKAAVMVFTLSNCILALDHAAGVSAGRHAGRGAARDRTLDFR